MQPGESSHLSPNAIRIEIARSIIERKQQELGEHFVAAACYSSVAHNAAMEHSDVELVILTDDTVPANEQFFFEHGIMVECDMLPASRMLTASRRVNHNWGIEADQYRHHLVISDSGGFFPRLWAAANDLPAVDFERALCENWWRVYEIRGKVLNAIEAHERIRTMYLAWEFATIAAMHIALHDRQPYESMRTLWGDVMARGYSMPELLDVLANGEFAGVVPALDHVWQQISAWGRPAGVTTDGE